MDVDIWQDWLVGGFLVALVAAIGFFSLASRDDEFDDEDEQNPWGI